MIDRNLIIKIYDIVVLKLRITGYVSFRSRTVNPSRVIIKENTYFGKGTRLECLSKGKSQQIGEIIIGYNNRFGWNNSILCADKIIIGNNNLFASNILITDIIHTKDANGSYINGDLNTKKIVIKDNCWIGQNVTILPGVCIGNDVIIGAGSVVTHDIPDNSIAYGVPAKVRK